MITPIIGYGIVKTNADLSKIEYYEYLDAPTVKVEREHHYKFSAYIDSQGLNIWEDCQITIFPKYISTIKGDRGEYGAGNFREMDTNEYMFDIYLTEGFADETPSDDSHVIGYGIVISTSEIWQTDSRTLTEFRDSNYRNGHKFQLDESSSTDVIGVEITDDSYNTTPLDFMECTNFIKLKEYTEKFMNEEYQCYLYWFDITSKRIEKNMELFNSGQKYF